MPLAVKLMDATGCSQFESVLEEVCAAEGHNKHHNLGISILLHNSWGLMSFVADDSIALAETATDNSLYLTSVSEQKLGSWWHRYSIAFVIS